MQHQAAPCAQVAGPGSRVCSGPSRAVPICLAARTLSAVPVAAAQQLPPHPCTDTEMSPYEVLKALQSLTGMQPASSSGAASERRHKLLLYRNMPARTRAQCPDSTGTDMHAEPGAKLTAPCRERPPGQAPAWPAARPLMLPPWTAARQADPAEQGWQAPLRVWGNLCAPRMLWRPGWRLPGCPAPSHAP